MSDAPVPDPESGAAESDAPAAPAPLERTQNLKLRELWQKQAKQRRRTTAAELLVKRPGQPEVRVPLDRSETLIGRDPRCHIVLAEPAASRRHARVSRGPGGYFEVADLGSRNGILVDGDVVDRCTLLDGDTFTVGDTRFSVVFGDALSPEPEAP